MRVAIVLLLTVPAHVLLLAGASQRLPAAATQERCNAAVRDAYERGVWDGWKKHRDAVGGGL